MDLDASELASRHHSLGQLFFDGVSTSSSRRASSAAFGVAGVLLVHQPRAVQLQRQRAFAIRFCASSMRLTSACSMMRTWGWSLTRRCRRTLNWAAPGAVLGVVQAGVVARPCPAWWRPCRRRCAPRSSCGTCRCRPAGLPDQVTHRRRLMPSTGDQPSPKFSSVLVVPRQPSVVQARQRHVVAHAGQLAVGVHQLLGHDEQRNALGAREPACRPAPGSGQHQVHDVFVSSWSPAEIHILLPLRR